jgi:hypothetical protein
MRIRALRGYQVLGLDEATHCGGVNDKELLTVQVVGEFLVPPEQPGGPFGGQPNN